MKKRILAICLVVAMAATAIVGASMAYLTDTDSDVNVMTLGNVSIEQHEYERAVNEEGTYEMVTSASGTGYKLQEFTQAKPLLPGVGSITGWGTTVYADQLGTSKGGLSVLEGMENVQDKFVSVENTGKTDAYVRTLIAFEQGTMSSEKFNKLVMSSLNDYSWNIIEIGTVAIDDNNYYVFELVYNDARLAGEAGVLPAGAFTSFSLGQVYLKPEATNEDCEALDGNGNGTYDILVLSQAVQTAGFSDAATALNAGFGEVNADNAAEWLGALNVPTVVSSAEELAAALSAGKSVVLTEDIAVTDTINIMEATDINLNGHNLTVSVLEAKADTTISDGTLTHGESTYPALSVSAGTLTMNDVEIVCEEYCNIIISNGREAAEYAGIEIWSGSCVLNDCTLTVNCTENRFANSVFGVGIHGGEFTMNGGSITVTSAGGTRYDHQAAIFAGSNPDKIVNLNNVSITAENLLYAWGGNTVVNTTDASGSWTTDKIDTNNGAGTYTINYVG